MDAVDKHHYVLEVKLEFRAHTVLRRILSHNDILIPFELIVIAVVSTISIIGNSTVQIVFI